MLSERLPSAVSRAHEKPKPELKSFCCFCAKHHCFEPAKLEEMTVRASGTELDLPAKQGNV